MARKATKAKVEKKVQRRLVASYRVEKFEADGWKQVGHPKRGGSVMMEKAV